MKPLLRFLRAHPWWTGAVAAVVVVWGGWGLREALTRARLVEGVEAWLAAHPEPAVGPLPEGDNAEPIYARIAEDLDAAALVNVVPCDLDMPVPPEARAVVEAHAAVLGPFEDALALPRNAKDRTCLRPSTVHALLGLVCARASMRAEDGDRTAAVRDLLLVHRFLRQAGGQWSEDWARSLSIEGLLRQLEEPGLDGRTLGEILESALRPEEVRAFYVRDCEWRAREYGRHVLDLLGPGGEARARARGWRPPTLAERLQAILGKGNARGVVAFPSAVAMERLWDAHRDLVDSAALRGRSAFPPVPDTGPPLLARFKKPGEEHLHFLSMDRRRAFAAEGCLAVLRTAAAVRLHEAGAGTLPDRLEDLVPGTLAELPSDPFGVGPLRWNLLPGLGTVESVWLPPGDGGGGILSGYWRSPQPRATLRSRK